MLVHSSSLVLGRRLTAPGLPAADGPETTEKLMSTSLVVANIKHAFCVPGLTPYPQALVQAAHSTPLGKELVVLH